VPFPKLEFQRLSTLSVTARKCWIICSAKANSPTRHAHPGPDLLLLDLKNAPHGRISRFLMWFPAATSPQNVSPSLFFSSSAQEQDITRAYDLGAKFIFGETPFDRRPPRINREAEDLLDGNKQKARRLRGINLFPASFRGKPKLGINGLAAAISLTNIRFCCPELCGQLTERRFLFRGKLAYSDMSVDGVFNVRNRVAKLRMMFSILA